MQPPDSKATKGPPRLDWWRALHEDEAEAARRLQKLDIEIAKGVPLLTLARELIQNEWGVLKNMNVYTLRMRLERHRDRSVLMPEGVEEGKQLTAQEQQQLEQALGHTLSVHTELQELAEMQKGRILEAISKEQRSKKHFTSLWKDVEVLNTVLKTLAEHQFNIGVLAKSPSLTRVGKLADGSTGIASTQKSMTLHLASSSPDTEREIRNVIDALKAG